MLSQFENKLRVRVCGIMANNDDILLLKHQGIGAKGFLWSPPGGGVEFGEDAREALIREFKEETGLLVDIKKFLFANQYIGEKLHAIELFFEVKHRSGKLMLGSDPEMESTNQILSEYKFFSNEEISCIDHKEIHNAFHHLKKNSTILDLKGFISFNTL